MTTLASSSPAGARVRQGLSWSLLGTVLLRVGNLLLSIMIARIVAPNEFGTFAVALTVWSILGTLAEFGLGADLVRSTEPETRAPTIATLGVLTSSTLALGMLVAAESIAAAFASPESTGVIRIMALSIALFGLSIVPAAHLQREFRQRGVIACSLAGLAACAIVTWLLASQGAGPEALAWGQVANQGVIVASLYAVTRSVPRFGLRWSIARDSLRFCLPLAFANLLSWVILAVDNLIVARTLGPIGLGFYVLAFNVSSWPMSVFGTAVRAVALPAFSQIGSESTRNRVLVTSMAPAAMAAGFMAVALAALAQPLIELLFGSRWVEAALALSGLAVFGGVRVILDLLATFLIAAGSTLEVLLVQFAWLVVMVPAMVLAVEEFGLQGAGWCHAAVAVLLVLPLYLLCLRKHGVRAAPILGQWALPAIVAVPAALATGWVAGAVGGPPIVSLVAGAATAAATYLLPLRRWCLRAIASLRAYDTAQDMLTEDRA